MSNIQVLRPKYRVEETLAEIKECLDIGWTGLGFKTQKFEEEWKKYTGHQFAHFLNSATSGLNLALNIFKKKFGWTSEAEIISTSLTFVSTNHAILNEQLTPVFADVDASLCLDPESVKKLINSRTKAVIFVGLGGNVGEYKKIRKICDDHGLILILDAAHMAGTKWKDTGKQVGDDADCVIYSYQAVKNCPSSDAGMICFPNEEEDTLARKLSWLGIDKTTFDRFNNGSYKWKYEVSDLGFKYHGNSIAAAISLVSLRYLDEDNAYRRHLAAAYDRSLEKFSAIGVVKHSDAIESSRHLYQICVEDRDRIVEMLAKDGIHCGVHYLPNHKFKIYEGYKADAQYVESVAEKLISLPLHLSITEADVGRVVASLGKIV